MGVQGKDFTADLLGKGVKPSKGLRQANLSPRTKAMLEEVALSEQVRMCAFAGPADFKYDGQAASDSAAKSHDHMRVQQGVQQTRCPACHSGSRLHGVSDTCTMLVVALQQALHELHTTRSH